MGVFSKIVKLVLQRGSITFLFPRVKLESHNCSYLTNSCRCEIEKMNHCRSNISPCVLICVSLINNVVECFLHCWLALILSFCKVLIWVTTLKFVILNQQTQPYIFYQNPANKKASYNTFWGPLPEHYSQLPRDVFKDQQATDSSFWGL